MKFPISIECTSGPQIASKVFEGQSSISTGTTIGVPGGVNITLESISEHRALDIPSTLQFVADTALTLDVGLFGAWLYDKVKTQLRLKITISDLDVESDSEELEQAIKAVLELLVKRSEQKHNK